MSASRIGRIAKSRLVRYRLARATNYPPLPTDAHQTKRPTRPPVFVISAGWRSGSTAVQRLIVSSGEVFVWGEPFPTARLLPRLQRIAAEVGVVDGQPDRTIAPSQIGPHMSTAWIATTNPAASTIMAGIKEMLETVYWTPLQETSFTSWGIKEVVTTPEQLRLLAETFPDAHFVCIVRNPISAYRSFRKFVISGVATKPGQFAKLEWIKGPRGYSRNWIRVARAFRTYRDDPRFHIFRHEDIAGDPDFPDALGQSLGLRLDPAVWRTVVGATEKRRTTLLERAEFAIVRSQTRTEAALWDYKD
ncbi:sulfotransferase [Nocardioides sp. YIM 152588]|uniref:sulfotransferase n=1 Tax=Nocardioides sp. YIM 152588 TaxID=3158259 RepID=UPI0032E500B4